MSFDFSKLEEEIRERGRHEVMDNGITVISEDIPGSGLASGSITVMSGSASESPADQGIMHFLEHLTFGSTGEYASKEERDQAAADIGLKLNAVTGPFNINYPIEGANQSAYLLQDNFPEAFRMIADIVLSPDIDRQSLVRERAVVQRELAEVENRKAVDPFHKIQERSFERLYGENPVFRTEILGTRDSIDAFTVERAKKYHSRFFAGSNLVVGLKGDLNGEREIGRMVQEMIESAPAGKPVPAPPVRPEKPYQGSEEMVVDSPTPGNSHVSIYFQVPSRISDKSAVMDALNYVLGGSMSSLLFKDVREEKGLVYSIQSGISGHAQTGILGITYSVASEMLDDSLRAVDNCLKKARTGEFSERQIEAYKATHLPGVISHFQQPGWINQELMERFNVDRHGYGTTGLKRLQGFLDVTKNDVIEAANQYLGENRFTVIAR